jgi:putative colanic acid biosysnthesis UDP-glucose lipid carrier transferase
MNRSFIRFLQLTTTLLDLLFLNLVVLFAYYFKKSTIPTEVFPLYLFFGLFLNISWIIIAWSNGVYNERNIILFEMFSRKTMQAYLFWLCIVMIYLFFFRQVDLSRFFIIAALAGYSGALLMNRFIYLFIMHYFRNHENLAKKIIILGYNDVAKKLAGYLEEDGINTRIIGFCEEPENVHELSNYPILGDIDDALEMSKNMDANEVEIYSTIAPEQNPDIYELMQRAERECIRFRLVPDLSYFIKTPVYVNYLKDMPILSARSEPLDDVSTRFRKRIFDIVVSSMVAIFILSWLIPIVSLLIWLESRGSVFFLQERTGKNNKSFRCIKFRSMRVNSEANLKQATRDDQRLTRIGKFMRRTNIDEFPQFINVLRGEMSVVGPRPHMVRHTEDFSKLVGQYMIRQFLKPGITGWAQVNGFRGEIKEKVQLRKRIEHDIWYLENWSFWLDVRIIFLTIYKTFRGDKNAF